MPRTNARIPSPSASAAPMIMFVRIVAAASGLRPIASDDFAVRMPMPMPGPRTPKPTAIPAASHARFMLPSCCFSSCGLWSRVEVAVRMRLDGMLRLAVLFVRFDREDEVDEDEKREDEALHEADEDLEADEGERESRHQQERAHDDEHDLAAEHVAPETERERQHPEDLAEELD